MIDEIEQAHNYNIKKKKIQNNKNVYASFQIGIYLRNLHT